MYTAHLFHRIAHVRQGFRVSRCRRCSRGWVNERAGVVDGREQPSESDGASKQRRFDLGLGEIRSSLAANPLRGGEPSISRMRTCGFQSAEGCWPSGGGRRLIEASAGRIRIARRRPRCLDHELSTRPGEKGSRHLARLGKMPPIFDWLASLSASLRLGAERRCGSCLFLITSPKPARSFAGSRCPLADRFFPVRSTCSSATVRRVLTRPSAFQLSVSR